VQHITLYWWPHRESNTTRALMRRPLSPDNTAIWWICGESNPGVAYRKQ